MSFSYPKHEKLKSQKQLDLLFSEGKTVSKYPLRLVYVPVELKDEEKIKFGVSVSKNILNLLSTETIINACFVNVIV